MYSIPLNGEILIDMLVNQPLSSEEQVKLLECHDKKIFRDGIDKGTELERRIVRERKELSERIMRKELENIFEPINDSIAEFKCKKTPEKQGLIS